MTERRVAIVTGAARGIGAAVARRLAADGFDVGVFDLDEASCSDTVKAVEAEGGRGLAIGADVSRGNEVQSAVERVASVLGPPLALVNNAGITRDNMLYKMTEEHWDQVISVHLRGAFLMTKAVQSYMTQATWGRIVNMSSVAALGNRGQVNYSAAKAGIQGFTKTVAIELAKFGVTANCIAPGFIETEMTAATAERLGITMEDFKKAASSMIPAGRVGQPDDIAHTVSFLVSDGAGFVNGQVIYVAGGPRD